MRAHFSNAAYGVLDYAAYPIAMLVSAPILLRHLGVAQYGIWIVTTAALNTGASLLLVLETPTSNTSRAPEARAIRDVCCARSGACSASTSCSARALAVVSWMLVPFAAGHLVSSGGRSASGVSPRTADRQRAHAGAGNRERLRQHAKSFRTIWGGDPYQSLCQSDHGGSSRGVKRARIWRRRHHGGDSLLHDSWNRRRSLSGCSNIWERPRSCLRSTVDATAALFQFGAFSWLLAVSSVIFTQADRLLLGVSLGATTVTAYALCVQMAQPIYGIASSGLHFLVSLSFGAECGLNAGGDQEIDPDCLRCQPLDRSCGNRRSAALRPRCSLCLGRDQRSRLVPPQSLLRLPGASHSWG